MATQKTGTILYVSERLLYVEVSRDPMLTIVLALALTVVLIRACIFNMRPLHSLIMHQAPGQNPDIVYVGPMVAMLSLATYTCVDMGGAVHVWVGWQSQADM